MRVKITAISDLLKNKLTNKGLSRKEAQILADEYLEGELQGKYSHGLAAFPSIYRKIKKNRDRAKLIKKTNSLIIIDANNDFGAIVGREIVEELIKMAKKEGIAVALIKNMTTWLRPGTVAKTIADKGFIGIVINTGGRPKVAPPGGYEPVIGTNPIAVSIPTEKQPILADMATAKKAWGEVRLAEKLGKELPKNTFYDKEGNFTSDPKSAFSVTSFGDYKGFSLGLLIEIICGSLIGMPMGSNNPNRGAMILTINPNIINKQGFKKSNSELIKNIKQSKKLKNTEEILIPGERALRKREDNIKTGYLEINDNLWKEINSL